MSLLSASLSLALSIVLEVVATLFQRLSLGFTRFWFSFFSIVSFFLSLLLSSRALTIIPITVVYAIWSSLGTLLTAVCGRLFFHEQFSKYKISGLFFIIIGVIFMSIETSPKDDVEVKTV
ncbi:hypothetical protein RCL1_002479 [Eukaryota sp. TZLM3-RCL]